MKKLIVILAFLLSTSVFTYAQPGPASAPRYMGKRAADPATCAEGSWYYNTVSHAFKYCSAANTWSSLGGGGGTLVTGSTDNAVLRADGTGGATSQGSLVTIDDGGTVTIPNAQSYSSAGNSLITYNSAGPSVAINSNNVGTLSLYAATSILAQSSVGTIFARLNGDGIQFGNGANSGFGNVASTVSKATDGSTGMGWLQTAGLSRVSANVTNATATKAAITGLSSTLQAGRKYAGTITLIAKNSTAAEGLQFDFNGGTATFTNIEFGFQATPPSVTLGTVISSTVSTSLTATTATTTDVVYTIYFTCVVNAAGTLIPQVAEVSHTSGTATVVLGSSMRLDDIP